MNNALLDTILERYLFIQEKKPGKNYPYKSFANLVKSIKPDITDWEIELLKEQLFSEGFLKDNGYGDGEPFELTIEGINAAQKRHYSSAEEDKRLDKEIKKQTLKNSKHAKTISIFAIIIPTLISLLALWISSQQPTTKEVREIKEKLDSLIHSIKTPK